MLITFLDSCGIIHHKFLCEGSLVTGVQRSFGVFKTKFDDERAEVRVGRGN